MLRSCQHELSFTHTNPVTCQRKKKDNITEKMSVLRNMHMDMRSWWNVQLHQTFTSAVIKVDLLPGKNSQDTDQLAKYTTLVPIKVIYFLQWMTVNVVDLPTLMGESTLNVVLIHYGIFSRTWIKCFVSVHLVAAELNILWRHVWLCVKHRRPALRVETWVVSDQSSVFGSWRHTGWYVAKSATQLKVETHRVDRPVWLHTSLLSLRWSYLLFFFSHCDWMCCEAILSISLLSGWTLYIRRQAAFWTYIHKQWELQSFKLHHCFRDIKKGQLAFCDWASIFTA